ncbi:MAG TPA: class II fructose-bisphosphate aldolase [Candidatus Paceibacterota bacterium]
MNLKETILNAQKNKRALWHFNVGSYEQWLGIKKAVEQTKDPLIVATSEGESSYISSKVLRALVNDAQSQGLPIFLGADHRKSKEAVEEALTGNVDVIVLDASKYGYDDNVQYVKKMSELCKQKNPQILTEGEIGFIGASSEIHEALDENLIKNLPGAELINKFIVATGIDLVAPALGTVHGIVAGGNPMIDIKHMKTICEQVNAPVVLHGGSGLSMETLKEVRHSGVSVIHINTDIRITVKEALKKSVSEIEDLAPYKYLQSVVDAVATKVQEFQAL